MSYTNYGKTQHGVEHGRQFRPQISSHGKEQQNRTYYKMDDANDKVFYQQHVFHLIQEFCINKDYIWDISFLMILRT